MSGIRGDLSALKGLRERLGAIGDGRFKSDLKLVLGGEALKLVADEFNEQRDPYGRPWKPSNGFGAKTLTNVRGLRNSFGMRVNGPGFEVGSMAKYAAIHQYGGIITARAAKYLWFKVPVGSNIARFAKGGERKSFFRPGKGIAASRKALFAGQTQWVRVKSVTIPQRQMIPEGTLGDVWQRAFNEETEAALNRFLFGR